MNNMLSKVSIIIPTFNRAAIVLQAIQSCLDQKYSNFEVVVIDDGSTDNTETSVRLINDERIQYQLIANSGAPTARNVGLQLASGQFIKFLDSDDLLDECVLFNQINRYCDPGLDNKAVVCGYHVVTDFSRNIVKKVVPSNKIQKKGYFDLADIVRRNPPTSSPLYRKEHLVEIGGFDERIPVLQDYDLAFRMARQGFQYRYFPDFTYFMRDHTKDTRVSTARKSINIEAHEKILVDQFDNLLNLYPTAFPLSMRRAYFERVAAITYKLAAAGESKAVFKLLKLLSRFPLSGSVRGYILAISSLRVAFERAK